MVAAGIPAGGAAYLALASGLTAAGLRRASGRSPSQLLPTRRGALGLATATLGLLFRAADSSPDTVPGAGWLRWATPLGWAELLRPLTGPQPLVLLLPAVTTALLLALTAGLARRRDVGAGLFPRDDSADPRLWLLSSPTAQALRSQATVVIAWLAATAALLMILGVVSHSLSTADVPANAQRQIAKLGSGSIVTPTGYIAFLFLFVALAICLFGCTQISALRRDEEQQLESVLAQPVSRSNWLAGRLILATFAAAAIALAAGIAAWVGATAAGVHVPLPSLLEAGVNALPIAILFLGLGGLAYALVPRVAAGIMYGLVAVAFLWQLVGALIGPPHWVLDLSPFAHLALVPTQPFQPVSAAVMVTVGVLGVISSLVAFSRRDIAGQ